MSNKRDAEFEMCIGVIVLLIFVFFFLTSCSVTKEVQGLQKLKAECDAFELELAGLKAKKWTDLIDKRADKCREHGFWTGKLDKQRRKTEREELMDEF